MLSDLVSLAKLVCLYVCGARPYLKELWKVPHKTNNYQSNLTEKNCLTDGKLFHTVLPYVLPIKCLSG